MAAVPTPSSDLPFEEEARLWARWRVAGDTAARERLVLHYLPLARTLAAVHYRGRIHADVEFDDYLQLARLGLMESVDRYEPERGAQFNTYAAHRIRGTLLNGLGKATEKSQQIAARKRLRAEQLESIKAAALDAAVQRNPEAGEATTGGSARSRQNALLAYLAEIGMGIALGVMLEDTGMMAAEGGSEDEERAAPAPRPDVLYFRKTELQRWQEQLREALARLPAQERKVIRYHYQQEVPFEEIAAMLGVSRSRISQLHRQGLGKLRHMLGQGPPCDIFL
jgi:RNA polymerase sigma factor for flagellar operon FliA